MQARLITAWGVLGVVALLGQALWRLTPLALDAIRHGLAPWQWGVMTLWILINAHAEGYRGFHKRFSPRVVARALHLGRHPRPLFVVFAPFFCMSLFHATRRGKIVARVLVVAIIGLVILVRSLEQPWRGIVDSGVVVGLGLGTASLLYFYVRALLGQAPPADPELPESDSAQPSSR